ncbi:MAG TPA: hypothetical protein VM434_13405 [Beijerinckiaceae bacterium]|nr:hypothetical protein [Beijerinckiaceae bacterium]
MNLRTIAATALCAGLAACTTAGSPLSGIFGNEPPPQVAATRAAIAEEVFHCPPVWVPDGAAAVQSYGGRTGDPQALRSQIALGTLARECLAAEDGSILVRVGIEGRALIGPAGGPGRYEAPVQVVIKRRDRIIASRSRRVAVTIPPGAAQAPFTLVEEGLLVPPQDSQEFEIEVRMGGGPARGRGPG